MAAPVTGDAGEQATAAAASSQALVVDSATQSFILDQMKNLQTALEGKLVALETSLLSQLGKLESRISALETATSLASTTPPVSSRSSSSLHSPKRSSTKTKSIPITLLDVDISKATILQSAFRAALARKQYAAFARVAKKRSGIIQEIIDTEHNYVNILNLIVAHYIKPLRERAVENNQIIPKEDIKAIFGDIEVLLGVNMMLVSMLDAKVAQAKRDPNTHMAYLMIGEVFSKIGDGLKIYTSYMDNYENAFKLLQKSLSENKSFAEFVEAAERKPDMQMLDLTSLLISPIQRIPRYRLLLQSLVAETWPEHPDAENLNKALRKMDEITQYVNTKKREAESTRKLVELQQELTGSPDSIIVESRRFIAETILHEDNEMRDYRVVVFNDAVLFAIQLSGRLKFKQLAHIGSISTAASEESPKTSFILTAGSKLYSLSAKSAKQVRQFVETIDSTREKFSETVEKSVDPSKYGTMSVRTGDSQKSIFARSGSGSFLKRERRVGNLKNLFDTQSPLSARAKDSSDSENSSTSEEPIPLKSARQQDEPPRTMSDASPRKEKLTRAQSLAVPPSGFSAPLLSPSRLSSPISMGSPTSKSKKEKHSDSNPVSPKKRSESSSKSEAK